MEAVRRGDLVTVSIGGPYGKPRPALVLQSDAFAAIPSITLAPLTSDLIDAPLLRLTVEPTPANGLRAASQVMIDKVMTVPRGRVGDVIGQADAELLKGVRSALIDFLELAQD